MARGPSTIPDALLIAAGAMLLLAGPYLLVQDMAKVSEAQQVQSFAGERAVPDGSDHATMRQVLLVPLGVLTVAGAWRLAVVLRDPRLRRWTARPVRLLLVGGALADLAWWLDATLPLDARGYRLLDPLYAIAGFLIVGASWRILTLVRPLPPGDPEAYGV